MRTRPVGALALSELGLGGGVLGNLARAISDEQAAQTIDAAWDAGIRYFDTAPHYGLGLSETRLGRALAHRPRDGFVLSTKVGRLLEPNPHPSGSDLAAGGFDVPDHVRRRFDFSRDGVRRSLAASLDRLGLDRVDIVYVHDADDHVDQAIHEALPALIELRDQGVVGAVGVGMNQWPAPLRMLHEVDLDVIMLAGRWTLLDRSGQPLLAECATRGVRIVAASPFNSGLLAHDRPRPESTFNYAPPPPRILDEATALADICAEFEISLPSAALQFPLRSSAVAAVVSGLRSPAEVDGAVQNLSHPIPAAAWARLDLAAPPAGTPDVAGAPFLS